jgi:hypothetical protein
MTVSAALMPPQCIAIERHVVAVVWFDEDGEVCRDRFHAADLELVSP